MYVSQNSNWTRWFGSHFLAKSRFSSSNRAARLQSATRGRGDYGSESKTIRVLLMHHDRSFSKQFIDDLETLNRLNVRDRMSIKWIPQLGQAMVYLRNHQVDVVVLEPFLTDGSSITLVSELEQCTTTSVIVIGSSAAIEGGLDGWPKREIQMFREESLNREELFWAIHDGVEQKRGSRALERIGVGYRFGRIKTLSER